MTDSFCWSSVYAEPHSGKLDNSLRTLWLWDLERMGFSIEYPIVQTDHVRVTENQVKVLECLRHPETLLFSLALLLLRTEY